MVKHLEVGEDLLEIIGKDLYLIDFYAEWCGPCQMQGPILEELTSIKVIKVNTDLHNDLAQSFGIMSIPTLVFFNNGLEMKREIGFRSKEDIEKIISEISK